MMKGVLIKAFGPPNVCKVADIVIPKPAAQQVLIKTRYAGLNPVDTYMRSGVYARKPTLPYTPGNDCAGVVESVGEGVTQFSPGDAVFTCRCVSGACAEYVTADVEYTFPLEVEKLTFQQGASLATPYFTAYRALIHKGGAKSGESVLIHGASGGVGTLCIQIAKHLGLKVFATAGSDKGLELIKTCGADYVYNHNQDNHCQQVLDDTGNEGVNLIIEMLANINLQNDLEMMSRGGRTVVVGNRGNIEEEWQEMRSASTEHQKLGWLNPVINAEYTLSQVAQAHEDIINASGAAGNLVINTTAL